MHDTAEEGLCMHGKVERIEEGEESRTQGKGQARRGLVPGGGGGAAAVVLGGWMVLDGVFFFPPTHSSLTTTKSPILSHTLVRATQFVSGGSRADTCGVDA